MNTSKINQTIKNKIDNLSYSFSSNPENIHFLKDLTNDSYTVNLVNSFVIFKSIDNILVIIYTNNIGSLIAVNIIDNKKINEIKNAVCQLLINSFNHFLDKINKRDLIISLSLFDNEVKVWNFNNLECLIYIQKINKLGRLYSACFFNNNNNIFVLTSNYSICESEPIKVYDFDGKKINEINDSDNATYFINTYYDNKLKKNFIISGNKGYVTSYDYKENKIYNIYSDENNFKYHINIVINDLNGIINLFESCGDEYVRIWDFHSGELLNKIEVSNDLYGLCLWNNNYIFAGCKNGIIKLINLSTGTVVKDLISHNKDVMTIKKILHPQYGECLISQGICYEKIKLWIIK
jgi:WD40 repeat protein